MSKNRDLGTLLSDLPDEVANLYAKNNIVGTVSETGGVPTGAAIERGSNANGEYVKFADGTLICLQTIYNVDANEVNSWIGYESLLISWTYPTSFLNIPNTSFTADSAAIPVAAGPGLTSTGSRIFFSAPLSNRTVYFVAIGRWY